MGDLLRDGHTGLLNEAYFTAALPTRVAAARRVLSPLSVALLAVAGAGDPVARAVSVADALRDTLREADTACRLADGRFALMLEGTPEDGAVWTVERIRRALDQRADRWFLWAGLASYPAHALDAPELLVLAGAALESARDWEGGRIEVAVPA